ncbi:hypothetical protein O3P69_008760 [Scylla paramamosain]|uniref:Uncharacterized protein n=1 Tax=Scylla paramamosain TaxID=85552 RepID=A0AAW0SM74_SCYPA
MEAMHRVCEAVHMLLGGWGGGWGLGESGRAESVAAIKHFKCPDCDKAFATKCRENVGLEATRRAPQARKVAWGSVEGAGVHTPAHSSFSQHHQGIHSYGEAVGPSGLVACLETPQYQDALASQLVDQQDTSPTRDREGWFQCLDCDKTKETTSLKSFCVVLCHKEEMSAVNGGAW